MLPIFIKFRGLFVPTNLSDNNLRHLGFKYKKILFLEIHEVIYLNSVYLHTKNLQSRYPVYIRAYFDIKNNGYNILPIKFPRPVEHSLDDFIMNGLVIVDYQVLNCSKALKKFTRAELTEINKMKNKLEEHERENLNNCSSNYLIYRRTKNFKRSDEPIGTFRFVDKFEKVSDVFDFESSPNELKIICLLSFDDFVILDMHKLEDLNFRLEPRLRKG